MFPIFVRYRPNNETDVRKNFGNYLDALQKQFSFYFKDDPSDSLNVSGLTTCDQG